MTLHCDTCGSSDLEIESQSYSEESAFESYRCRDCGATGTLVHDSTMNTTELDGLESRRSGAFR